MPDVHLNTGAYALDALDDVEHRAMQRHLGDCDACTVEVREFHQVTVMLAERVAQRPPETLRAAVMDGISRTRQVSPDEPRRLPRLTWRSLVSAAAAVLVAFTAGVSGIAWQAHRSAEQARVEADRFTQVMADPSRTQAQGRPSVGGTAAVYESGGQAVLLADRMPSAPDGRTYQVWVIQGKAARSAGLLTLHDGTGRVLIPDVPAGANVAMTVEPDGGSRQPTTTPILKLQAA